MKLCKALNQLKIKKGYGIKKIVLQIFKHIFSLNVPIKKNYNRNKKSYLRYTLACRTRKVIWLLKRYMTVKQSSKSMAILDVGCADGLMTKEISRQFPFDFVLGAEKNINFTSLAKKTKTCFINADGCFLPFKSKIFNAIVASAVFKHIPYPELFARESFRVLNYGGFLIICDPRPFVIRVGMLIKKFDQRWMFNQWSLREHVEFFSTKGFRPVFSSYYISPIPFGERIELLLEHSIMKTVMLHQIAVFKKCKKLKNEE